jgi:hypothetical protein
MIFYSSVLYSIPIHNPSNRVFKLTSNVDADRVPYVAHHKTDVHHAPRQIGEEEAFGGPSGGRIRHIVVMVASKDY